MDTTGIGGNTPLAEHLPGQNGNGQKRISYDDDPEGKRALGGALFCEEAPWGRGEGAHPGAQGGCSSANCLLDETSLEECIFSGNLWKMIF